MSFDYYPKLINDPLISFIGLDCETSGVGLQEGHVIIQAGLAAMSPETGLQIFSSLINPSCDHPWDAAAEKVHGINLADLSSAPTSSAVDRLASSFIKELYPDLAPSPTTGGRTLYAVGFNVGSFDFPFFNKFLPSTSTLVSHRSVDLNSLCLLLHGLPFEGTVRSWSDWKFLAKDKAFEFLDSFHIEGTEHDAGYDAALGLGCFMFLRSVLASLNPLLENRRE